MKETATLSPLFFETEDAINELRRELTLEEQLRAIEHAIEMINCFLYPGPCQRTSFLLESMRQEKAKR